VRYQPSEALGALVKGETAFWAKTIEAGKITAD
jgi:hypothetical protein